MASKKKMNISIDPEQVVYSQISKSSDGYNSARMVVKSNEKEYMAISYEWEGEGVPDFVMGMMGFMQANEIQLGEAEELAAEYDVAKSKKGVNPFAKKKDEDMEDDEDPKGKKDKKDKKSKKKKDGKKKEKSDDGSLEGE
jgi:hypothetical protein